jgi:C-terminal processing protease CtpA/Prc
MSSASLAQLTIDLDTDNQAKDGVVIDIRNNEGGFVDPYVTDIFSRRNFINFKVRGRPLAPERPSLGQRTLDRPTVLVTNANSLSDAENFTEDYRRAHLGKVVGEPTAGWIIFTDRFRMVDDSTVRVPLVKTLTLDGVNMNGIRGPSTCASCARSVKIFVTRTPNLRLPSRRCCAACGTASTARARSSAKVHSEVPRSIAR